MSRALLHHGGAGSVISAQQALALIYQELQRSAAALSYLDGFRLIAALLALASPLVWIMRKPSSRNPQAAE